MVVIGCSGWLSLPREFWDEPVLFHKGWSFDRDGTESVVCHLTLHLQSVPEGEPSVYLGPLWFLSVMFYRFQCKSCTCFLFCLIYPQSFCWSVWTFSFLGVWFLTVCVFLEMCLSCRLSRWLAYGRWSSAFAVLSVSVRSAVMFFPSHL